MPSTGWIFLVFLYFRFSRSFLHELEYFLALQHVRRKLYDFLSLLIEYGHVNFIGVLILALQFLSYHLSDPLKISPPPAVLIVKDHFTEGLHEYPGKVVVELVVFSEHFEFVLVLINFIDSSQILPGIVVGNIVLQGNYLGCFLLVQKIVYVFGVVVVLTRAIL